MNRKQLTALFLCSLIPWTVGNGLIPLLPVYAEQLGADSTAAGLYLAFSYLAIALGAVSAGWVSGSRFGRKLPLVVGGLTGPPLAWLMGQATSLWQLSILTALIWFFGGLGLALTGILTGLSAESHERGKIFGMLALTGGLGAVIGGVGAGFLVEEWGYEVMFTALAVFLMAWPLSALLLEEVEYKTNRAENLPASKTPALGKSFYIIFSAAILGSITNFFIVLIRSIHMSELGFGVLEISSTGVIGGLVLMPLPLLMGWLSDRINRKPLLLLGYLSGLVALILLAFSTTLWHFWLVFTFQGIAMQSNGSVGNAWVTDLLPREGLGKGLALFGATGWIGGVIGFAAAGFALQTFGMAATLIIGGCLTLGAIVLLTIAKGKIEQS